MPAGARLLLPAALLPLLVASLALAEPAALSVDLTWTAPTECPSREAVLDEVARLLALSRESRAHATARADVTRDERSRWHAVLSVDARGAHGERTLDAEGCPAIASATALIIAVAVEGGMPQQQAVPPPVPTLPAPLPAASPPAQRASQLIVAAAGAIDYATLPSLAPGIEATLGWGFRWSTWRIRTIATGGYFPTRTSPPLVDPAEVAGERGSFDFFTASVRACASIVRGAFDVGPCLGAAIDIVTGRGVGGSSPLFTALGGTGMWGSAVGSVLASWSFSRHIAVFLRADGRLSPAPPAFGVGQQSTDGLMKQFIVHKPSEVGARAALGVELRFF